MAVAVTVERRRPEEGVEKAPGIAGFQPAFLKIMVLQNTRNHRSVAKPIKTTHSTLLAWVAAIMVTIIFHFFKDLRRAIKTGQVLDLPLRINAKSHQIKTLQRPKIDCQI